MLKWFNSNRITPLTWSTVTPLINLPAVVVPEEHDWHRAGRELDEREGHLYRRRSGEVDAARAERDRRAGELDQRRQLQWAEHRAQQRVVVVERVVGEARPDSGLVISEALHIVETPGRGRHRGRHIGGQRTRRDINRNSGTVGVGRRDRHPSAIGADHCALPGAGIGVDDLCVVDVVASGRDEQRGNHGRHRADGDEQAGPGLVARRGWRGRVRHRRVGRDLRRLPTHAAPSR